MASFLKFFVTKHCVKRPKKNFFCAFSRILHKKWSFLRIRSHLLKKSLMESFIFLCSAESKKYCIASVYTVKYHESSSSKKFVIFLFSFLYKIISNWKCFGCYVTLPSASIIAGKHCSYIWNLLSCNNATN